MNTPVKHTPAVALVVATAAAAAGALLVPATANADTHYNLPSETQSATMGDGTVVTFKRIRERATVNPSLGGTPLHRNAWVSGKFAVTLSKEAKKFEIRPGYLVGCQVNIGGATGEGGAGIASADEGVAFDGAEVGGSLTLGPGQAQAYYLVDAEKADDFGAEKHDRKITYKKTKRGTLTYTNSQLSLRGCGGYAQARSFATIVVETKKATQYRSFYGRPFSLG
ncbi:MAG TPA: MspA family porin [Gordonia sp. (in: high G+C Gram-positive bacteria)]|uniref:MspA family porin n=1 Tax=unclassified Gordonia (in: high G+C Gram-positive bacteria) TaxID=2657482 RepID=UPI0025BD415E|nr:MULTISPECIES: MspA family porin [unclassified Gordonia (in: high G+C Gram-positive bacteria)]HNP55680.1 MspA family porin [Gordonia sp. (in: high G+C Gram-positive bacteria)]HRC49416.1 MspA family porin [Gordonia sp. (in: high G+C Gram-positive bacteria)]